MALSSSLFRSRLFAADASPTADWLPRWEKYTFASISERYCDKSMAEDLAWFMSPFMSGFHHGYLLTRDTKWIDLLFDWTDAWIARGIKEPDGCIGWPKENGASTNIVPNLYCDNILGEAMAFTPLVAVAGIVRKAPKLKKKYAAKADKYLALAEQTFTKWDNRSCWRETRKGGVWVVPPFGIDQKTGQWSSGYEHRAKAGFTLPPNKQNEVARWLLVMHDVCAKPIYRERAEKWFKEMKSRLRLREEKYYVWNYWDPAGPWDYKPDGSPKHWVGVHPNGGYFAMDVDGMVTAFENQLVFDKSDIDRLIATNRDYMWNQDRDKPKFKRIDGGEPKAPWQDTPGVLWPALAPYDLTLKELFEKTHKPDSWSGLALTPKYLARRK